MANLISAEYANMLVRFLISLIVNWVIIDRLYYVKSRRRDFYFTFMLIGIAIFLVVYFMIFVLEDMKGKTSMGIGIGLFGIFSIMRYRTDTMPVREMTYLFVLICLSVVNALATSMTLAELLITNLIVVVVIWVCEKRLKLQPVKLVQYDRIELIKPERYNELKADLEERLGLKILKVEVGGVDMLRDMAVLKVYYEGNSQNDVNGMVKMGKVTLLLAALIAMPAMAQTDDFGLYTSVGVTKKIDKQWSAGIEVENRLQDGLSAEDRVTLGLGVDYKPMKWLKFDAGYKFIRQHALEETNAKITKYSDNGADPVNIKYRTSDAFWYTRHRVYFSATVHQKAGDLDFSLRERWQYTYRPSTETTRQGIKYNIPGDEAEAIKGETDPVNGKGAHVLRSRLQVQYDKKKCAWQPYASVEMFNGDSSFGIQKMRYTAGLEWKISKQHSIDLYYRYQRVKKEDSGESLMSRLEGADYDASLFDTSLFGNNNRNSHIIGLGYTFKL